MTVWAMEHPWMTFVLILAAIILFSESIKAFANKN